MWFIINIRAAWQGYRIKIMTSSQDVIFLYNNNYDENYGPRGSAFCIACNPQPQGYRVCYLMHLLTVMAKRLTSCDIEVR